MDHERVRGEWSVLRTRRPLLILLRSLSDEGRSSWTLTGYYTIQGPERRRRGYQGPAVLPHRTTKSRPHG
jgi:hypothetical protein